MFFILHMTGKANVHHQWSYKLWMA